MELSVAIVVLLLKIGIKQLDPEYDVQKFLSDIVESFGEKTGNKIAGMLTDSKNVIDDVLKDDNLKTIGIPLDSIAAVRENTKAILKYVQIGDAMLIDYNCDVSDIVDYLLADNVEKAGIKNDDQAINDVRRVLMRIVQKSISMAKDQNVFISGLLLDVKKRVEESSVDIHIIKKTTFDIQDTGLLTLSNTEDIIKLVEDVSRKMDRFEKNYSEEKKKPSTKKDSQWTPPSPPKKQVKNKPMPFLGEFFRKRG